MPAPPAASCLIGELPHRGGWRRSLSWINSRGTCSGTRHWRSPNDALALALAQEAVSAGADQALVPVQRSFFYMPYMHSESVKIHEVAVELFERNGIKGSLDFELKHKAIIEKFGRYPHRNEVLGRVSTEAEIEFLRLPGSGFLKGTYGVISIIPTTCMNVRADLRAPNFFPKCN